MASAAVVPTIPNRGARGPRMSRAVVDLGGDILRNALYHHYTPAVANAEVLRLRGILNHPFRSKLNAHQMSVLQSASIKGDYSECDITLLYTLLRNLPITQIALCPTAGWGAPVQHGSVALGDAIERIRDLRNQMYGHTSSTAISVGTYNQLMTELYHICFRMDTNHATSLQSPTPRNQTYCQELTEIQVACMDPDTEEWYTDEIKRMEDSDKEIRYQIDEIRCDLSGIEIVSS